MSDFGTIEKIKEILETILAQFGVEYKVSPEDSLTKGLVFNISSPDSRLLIGKQGANLYALQTIVIALASKQLGEGHRVFFTIDVDDYRKNREWHLKEDIKRAADKVRMTGRPVELEPMPSFERRFAHAWISEHFTEFETESIGADPYRKLVIKLRKLNQ